MNLCWVRSWYFFVFFICIAASNSVLAQDDDDECELAVDVCAPPTNGWFSHVTAERLSGVDGFTGVNLTWNQIMNVQRDYMIAYRALNTTNSSYMFSMRIRDMESFLLEGLEQGTSYYVVVCRPNVNESLLSESEEPLLFRECGYCSTCFTTRTAELTITEASHEVGINGDIDIFECEAFGEPRPKNITWTAIDPETGERVQLTDGEGEVSISQERLTGNRLASLLEAPLENDLLISGQINCIASNEFLEAIADTRRFIQVDVDDQTPTNEVNTTEDFIPINTTIPLPAWAIAVIVVAIVALAITMTVVCLIVTIKYRHLKKRAGKDVGLPLNDLKHRRHKSNDYYKARELKDNTEGSHSIAIGADKIIPSDCIKLSNVVGQGEFGVVYKAILMSGKSQELVAVKTLKGIFATDADVKSASEEILKMQRFNHPNVMTLIGVCVSGEVGGSGGPSIVMPYMSQGSLLNYLRKEASTIKPTSHDDITQVGSVEKTLMQICLQVAKGMEYLAGLMFVHRDLAARNCMIGFNGNIKVADFGLAEDVYMRNYFRQDEGSSVKLPIKWMALESLKLGVFSEKSDVWSYGVTCWEVFTAGEIPYPGLHPREVIKYIEDGERMDKPKNAACSDDMYGLITSCWAFEPEDRPTFSELVSSIETRLMHLGDYLTLNIGVDNDQDHEGVE